MPALYLERYQLLFIDHIVEEELRIMEQREKQQRERREPELEARSKLPEEQLQMFVSGHCYKMHSTPYPDIL
jgi:hypothetical protein